MVLLVRLGQQARLEAQAQSAPLALPAQPATLEQVALPARLALRVVGLPAPRGLLGLLVLLVEDLLALLDRHLLLLGLRVRQVTQARLALLVPLARLVHPAVADRHFG